MISNSNPSFDLSRYSFYHLVRELSKFSRFVTFCPAPYDFCKCGFYLRFPYSSDIVNLFRHSTFEEFEAIVDDDIIYIGVPFSCTPNGILKNFYYYAIKD